MTHYGSYSTNTGVGEENRYRYNGMERDDELGLDLALFRSYDPAIGRWLQVDPLAELAPDWTPYRFGFDNPVLWSDKSGLFESRKEAREYRRSEKNGLNWFNTTIEKQKDGTYAIESNNSSTQVNQLGDIMSNSVVGTTQAGEEVTTVARVRPKDRMPSSGKNSTFLTVEMAQFRDGTSWTVDRPILVPSFGSVASGGARLASFMGRVPKGQLWINLSEKLPKLRKAGQWLPKGVAENRYIKFLSETAESAAGSAGTKVRTYVGKANQYGNDVADYLKNAARKAKHLMDGGHTPGG